MSLTLTPRPTRTDISTTSDTTTTDTAITDTAISDDAITDDVMALVSVSDIVGDAAPHAESDHESDDDAGTTYARCADGNGTLSHLFFSDDDHDLARAKAICRPCGLKAACLSGALERAESYGVWGGLLVLDGVAVEVQRRRGRPPKHPKPVLVVDEVPIPDHLVA